MTVYQVSYNSRKGFYLTLPAPAVGGGGGRRSRRGRTRADNRDSTAAAGAATPSDAGGWRSGPAEAGYPVETATAVEAGILPSGLMLLERRENGSLSLTTHELNALNARLLDSVCDCLTLTQRVSALR